MGGRISGGQVVAATACIFGFCNASAASSPEQASPSAPYSAKETNEQAIFTVLDDIETLWAKWRRPRDHEVELWSQATAGFELGAESMLECAFTMFRINNDKPWRKVRFDPERTPRWQLVSVGGSPPTEEQQSKSMGLSMGNSLGLALSSVETPIVLHRMDESTFFGVRPHLEDGWLDGLPRALRKTLRKTQLRMTFLVSHRNPTVRLADIRTTRSFSPRLGTRISLSQDRRIYDYDQAAGAVVMKYRESKMRGRFFGVARFKADLVQWFEDFSCD